MTTTTATPRRRFRARHVAAIAATLAIGATILAAAPAADAAESGSLTWDSGFVIDTGRFQWSDPTRFQSIGAGQGTYLNEIVLEISKTDTDGQPLEGVEYTVEWVPVEATTGGLTSAWMDRAVWADVRDRDLEQVRLDAVDAYVDARDAWQQSLFTQSGDTAELQAAMDERRDEHAVAADALADQLAPHAASKFTITTDENGEATLNLLGQNNYTIGQLIVTETAVPDGVSTESVGASIALNHGGAVGLVTDRDDVFVESELTTIGWNAKKPAGDRAHFGHTGSNRWDVAIEAETLN